MESKWILVILQIFESFLVKLDFNCDVMSLLTKTVHHDSQYNMSCV